MNDIFVIIIGLITLIKTSSLMNQPLKGRFALAGGLLISLYAFLSIWSRL